MTLTMVGRLAECVLVSYRTPAGSVRGWLPAGLELVTRGEWAFWNIVACRVEGMRPAGLPSWLGLDYHHVAYRLLVRAQVAGATVDGLYFLRSDADNGLIAASGNWLSDFRFHRAAISVQGTGRDLALRVRSSGRRGGEAELEVENAAGAVLAEDSCFASAAEAAGFLKYRPLGLAVDERTGNVKLAEVFRDEARWREQPLRVARARWEFLENLGQGEARLEWASRVAPIDYRWRLGRRLAAGRSGKMC